MQELLLSHWLINQNPPAQHIKVAARVATRLSPWRGGRAAAET